MGTLTTCTLSTLDFNSTVKSRQIPNFRLPKKPKSSCFLCRRSIQSERVWFPRRSFRRLRCYSSSDNGNHEGETSSSGSSNKSTTDSATTTTTTTTSQPEAAEDTRTDDYDSDPPSVSSRVHCLTLRHGFYFYFFMYPFVYLHYNLHVGFALVCCSLSLVTDN